MLLTRTVCPLKLVVAPKVLHLQQEPETVSHGIKLFVFTLVVPSFLLQHQISLIVTDTRISASKIM